MKTKTLLPEEVEFSNDGNVYVSGELYGTEEQYYNDVDSGKIYIADSKITPDGTKYYDHDGNLIKIMKLKKQKVGRWFRYYFENGVFYYTQKQLDQMIKWGHKIEII